MLAAVIVVAAWFAGSVYNFKLPGQRYQAVFLSNNQVYFGKFHYPWLGSTAKLTDIYYLQVNQSLQQQKTDGQQSDMKLVKFGSEIHGPQDKMIIPKNQILFWENLKDDSLVVKTILENKNKK